MRKARVTPLCYAPRMKVAIYTRLSDDREGRSTGIERQLQACRQYAESQGWQVVSEHSDTDLSAFKRGVVRPGYEEMIAHLDDVDAILVWKLDRLVRRFLEFARIWSIFEEKKVAIVSATEPIDTSSAIGRIIVLMLVGFAELESETISLRQKSKHAELARKGMSGGGGRPAYPDEVLVEASQRLINGDSLYAIARDHGVVASHLKRSLMSPRMVGRRNGQEVAQGTLQPIVDDATWEEVRGILSSRARPAMYQGRRHLLTGLAHCARCGSKLQINHRRGRMRYQCKAVGCGGVSIEKGALEDLVVEGVVGLVDRSDMPALASDDKVLRAQIQADEQALADLTAARFVERYISDDEYRAARDPLVSRIEHLRQQLTVDTLPQMQGKAREAWASADLHWRRSLLAAVLERVVVHPSKRGGQKGVFGSSVDLSRVEPVFRV